MLKKLTVLALLAITGSAQAITWNDYYRAHEKEIVDEVETGKLDASNKGLTDLIGFAQTPGLNKLKRLFLDNNQLASLAGIGNLPSLEALELQHNQLTSLEGIDNLPALYMLDLSENQLKNLAGIENLPLLEELILEFNHLTTLEGVENLPLLRELKFSDNPMPKPEEQLLNAIRSGQDLPVVQRWFTWIRDKVVQDLNEIDEEMQAYEKINIPSIHEADGDNILHLAVQTAAQRLARVRHKINSNKALSETERARQMQKYTTALNDFYTKILNILLSCDQACVHEMLYAPNAQGQTVIESALRRLGADSPIVKVILNALSQSRQQEAEQKEKEQKNRAAEQG